MSFSERLASLGEDNSGLPRCNKTKEHISYWKDFWSSCVKDSSQQECCDQVTCRNPKSIDIPCHIIKKQGVGPNRWNELNPNKQDNCDCIQKKTDPCTMFAGVR